MDNRDILKKLVIILFITESGSQLFYKELGFIFIPLFLAFSFLLFYRENKFYVDRYNWLVMCFIVLWNLINNYLIHGNVGTNLVFSMVLTAVASFFTISSFDFYEFREKLLKYLSVLSLLSIVIQLWHDIFGISIGMPSEDTFLSFYIFNTDWGENRLASIFWEPGMYQIVLFFTLCLFTDEFKDLKNWKFIFKKFGILFLALIYTKSTMAYLCFFALLGYIYIRYNTDKTKIYLMPLYVGVIAVAALFLWQTDAIQKKLSQRDSEIGSTSYYIRLNDNISLLTMSMERPFVGYGVDTPEYEQRNRSLDNLSASNGWLFASATNGVIYLLIVLSVLYKGIKRLPNPISHWLILFVLIITQCNEYMICMPYLFMYILRYKQEEEYEVYYSNSDI